MVHLDQALQAKLLQIYTAAVRGDRHTVNLDLTEKARADCNIQTMVKDANIDGV